MAIKPSTQMRWAIPSCAWHCSSSITSRVLSDFRQDGSEEVSLMKQLITRCQDFLHTCFHLPLPPLAFFWPREACFLRPFLIIEHWSGFLAAHVEISIYYLYRVHSWPRQTDGLEDRREKAEGGGSERTSVGDS